MTSVAAPYQVMPALSAEEREALKADIAEHGVMVPVEYDESGNILDGHHRVDICGELGLSSWPRLIRYGLTEEQKLTHARRLNLNRRHLDQAQRRALIEAELKQAPQASDRKIADGLGVDHKTVGSARDRLESTGEIPQLEKREGKDSRVRQVVQFVPSTPAEERGLALSMKAMREERQGEKRERRDAREVELAARQAALPEKRYGVILADPEWRFEPWSRATGMDRAADNHYPTSVTEVIAARPVGSIAANDCVLFLWATAPMLPQALLVMGAWGFDYVSHIIWDKDRIGTGYWFRGQHELLLVGTRGTVPAPAMGTQWASIVESPASRVHSEKPVWQYELIEKYFPNLPKIELNARCRRPGWDPWGNEAPEEEALNGGIPHSPIADGVPPDAEEAAPRLSPAPLGEGAASTRPFDDGPDLPACLDRRGLLAPADRAALTSAFAPSNDEVKPCP